MWRTAMRREIQSRSRLDGGSLRRRPKRAKSARMKPFHTRILAVILYPPEVKRQLATLEAATARALELAGQKIQRDLYRPPRLEALRCTVEVIDFDLRPSREMAWT